MKKTTNYFPGKTMVSFRKGPSGHLRQDPSDEAMRIKKNPSLEDKSPPQRHDLVKTNALTVVFERGGDVSDRLEVMGEYVLQFGKYKGKLFRWLLENDVGYTIYLMKKVEEEERDGTFNPQGHNKDSLLSFLDYARSFQEIRDLREYLASRLPAPPVASEGDNTVGFGARAKDTWRQIWESRADGYAAFIVGVKCIKNSKMYNLQQYILKQQRAESGESCPPPAGVSTTSAAPTPPTSSILAHRTEPTATVSRPAEPDDSSGIVASVKARLKAPLPAPSTSSAQMICGLQHVEPGCRHVVLNCDKHRVQPNIPAAVAMETKDHCPAALVATDSQETSEDPVGVVLITQLEGSFSRAPVPAVPAHSCYQRQSFMDTGGVSEPVYSGADWVRHPG
ncbi:hypothetical protein EPR50_G00185490 [Perca flavescens]|uniref:Uncharacterized protein n=1 Tax=Perca flavescens TaxID=8167 RepID=A0A484CEI6_PERFV|nr:hypothetical protein EPR50_G00185490 [Perca flavescens]